MCLSRTTHRHEADTKAKFKRKEWCMQEQQKRMSKQTPNPLKISLQGKCSKRGWGMCDDRDVHYPWGTALRPLPKENTYSRSSRRRFLCSYLHASTPTISEHNRKFLARKKFPDCLLSDLFLPLTMTTDDWNRWFASLATTVDNTIKMAERSFKHGRQWCIRRIAIVNWKYCWKGSSLLYVDLLIVEIIVEVAEYQAFEVHHLLSEALFAGSVLWALLYAIVSFSQSLMKARLKRKRPFVPLQRRRSRRQQRWRWGQYFACVLWPFLILQGRFFFNWMCPYVLYK